MTPTELLTAWLNRFSEVVQEHETELTALDSAIGDADHGSNLTRGMKTVTAAFVTDESAPAMLKKVGMGLLSSVGGASGPLFGTLFLKMAGTLGDDAEVNPQQFAAALRAGADGVQARGKAQAGEKTMLDALLPATEAFEAAASEGADLAEAARRAAEAADQGRDATEGMKATKGRASYLGDASVGHIDPGAASVALLMQSLATVTQ